MQVTVDYRERNPKIIATLESFTDVELQYELLFVGDYRWPAGLVFERKTLVDLLDSLRTGRLFLQAYRLRKAAEQPVMILEGTLRNLISYPELALSCKTRPPTTPIETRRARNRIGSHRATAQGALIHLSVNLGIPILRSTGPEETAWLMRTTALQLDPNRPPLRIRSAPRPRTTNLKRLRLRLLQQIPGIGPDRASSLLSHFGTPAAVLKADLRALCQAQGVGTALAKKIRRIAGDC